MAKRIGKATRKRVAELIPVIAAKVLANYQDLVNAGVVSEKDGKRNDKAHYETCKAAAAHLQLILKLAEWAEVPPDKSGLKAQEIQRYLEDAQKNEAEWNADFDGDDGEVV